jgi:hypothetical protein
LANNSRVKRALETFQQAAGASADESVSEYDSVENLKPKSIQRLARPIERAFEAAGLDPSKAIDWKIMVVLFASAVYAGKGPGQPKRWKKKRLRRLVKDIEEIKKGHREASELKCCQLLVKKKDGKRSYEGKNPDTLRRALQSAKQLDKGAHRPAGPETAVVFAEMQKCIEEKPEVWSYLRSTGK